jgi:tryptophan-rich sensory protein
MNLMTSNKTKSLLALAGFGAAVAGAAWFGSRYSPKDPCTRLWYSRLDKPSYNPPDYVFPIVWSSLYALMAISGWRVWQEEDSPERSKALKLWAAQLASNAEWTRLFFGEHRPVRALADVAALETMIARYIATARKVDSTAALCFVPYAAWVGFATVLNADIARRNPDAWKKLPRPRAA